MGSSMDDHVIASALCCIKLCAWQAAARGSVYPAARLACGSAWPRASSCASYGCQRVVASIEMRAWRTAGRGRVHHSRMAGNTCDERLGAAELPAARRECRRGSAYTTTHETSRRVCLEGRQTKVFTREGVLLDPPNATVHAAAPPSRWPDAAASAAAAAAPLLLVPASAASVARWLPAAGVAWLPAAVPSLPVARGPPLPAAGAPPLPAAIPPLPTLAVLPLPAAVPPLPAAVRSAMPSSSSAWPATVCALQRTRQGEVVHKARLPATRGCAQSKAAHNARLRSVRGGAKQRTSSTTARQARDGTVGAAAHLL
eukprot:358258-Chlamydomonas_euryale.AAC.5